MTWPHLLSRATKTAQSIEEERKLNEWLATSTVIMRLTTMLAESACMLSRAQVTCKALQARVKELELEVTRIPDCDRCDRIDPDDLADYAQSRREV